MFLLWTAAHSSWHCPEKQNSSTTAGRQQEGDWQLSPRRETAGEQRNLALLRCRYDQRRDCFSAASKKKRNRTRSCCIAGRRKDESSKDTLAAMGSAGNEGLPELMMKATESAGVAKSIVGGREVRRPLFRVKESNRTTRPTKR